MPVGARVGLFSSSSGVVPPEQAVNNNNNIVRTTTIFFKTPPNVTCDKEKTRSIFDFTTRRVSQHIQNQQPVGWIGALPLLVSWL